MEMVRGNEALRDHHSAGKQVHVFEYVARGMVQYVGEAVYAGHVTRVAPDRDGKPRSALVFQLAMKTGDAAEGEPGVTPEERREDSVLWNRPIEYLRRLALVGDEQDSGPVERKRNAYSRSQALRVYVIRRSSGLCEGCGWKAPFATPGGHPYLEPHHIRRRADGGPDHPRWVVALCPNCHRRVHYGVDGEEYNRVLADVVGRIEAEQARTADSRRLSSATSVTIS
jgi:5-methylcytosine-specific restriction enzyme A